ncbi:MAG: glycosyltransferase [Myxococcota bacterium]
MRATLVIPTYNRAERLRALLHCVAQQEGALARVIVCDDGSSDHTREVATSFEDRLPLVYAHQEDLGFRAGQARNLGIDRAIGEVVIFVDDDVLLRPDFVEAHLAVHREQDVPSIVLGFRHRTDAFVAEMPTWAQIVSEERDDRVGDLRGAEVHDHPQPWIFVYSCNFSIRLGHEELRFDEGFRGWGMEDTELGYRLHHAGYRILAAPQARVLHVEDPAPRDPFRCEARELPPSYTTYVQNAVYFMDKYPEDEELAAWIRGDIRWYILDEHGRWVKNGFENDVEFVIETCRKQIAARQAPAAE